MIFKNHFSSFIPAILAGFIVGCVDVNETNIPPTTDYRSLVRFVHVASDNPGATAIVVDGATVATGTFEQATAYLDIASGTRQVGFAGTTTGLLFETQNQYTVFIHTPVGGERFARTGEGYVFSNSGQSGKAGIKFVHVAAGSAPSVSFLRDSATGTALTPSDVSLGNSSGYVFLTPGNYQPFVVSSGGYAPTLEGSQEVPPVTTTSTGTGAIDLSLANGVEYSISVTSDNSQGFYLFAHFHNGPPGVIGNVVKPIDVSGQEITFPITFLRGQNEVPPSTSAASGAGTFTLTANSARDTFSLAYSITVTADILDSVFNAAHFHNGGAGEVAPPYRTIATGPFGDTTVTGTWSTGDTTQPLTAALVSELLVGRIYVNFHTTLRPGGAIRAQVVPDPASTNVFEGTWNDSTLTDSLKNEIVRGNIYVNFHTAANPVGQIRGQLVVDPAKGHYGIASLPAADIAFAAGRLYTVAATGSGLNLKVIKLTDRQP